MTDEWDRVWYFKTRLPERRGTRCRVLVSGARNSALVEFEDGYQTVTSRWAVRKWREQIETDDMEESDGK